MLQVEIVDVLSKASIETSALDIHDQVGKAMGIFGFRGLGLFGQ